MIDRNLTDNGLGIAFAAFASPEIVGKLLNIDGTELAAFQNKARNDFVMIQADIARAKKPN